MDTSAGLTDRERWVLDQRRAGRSWEAIAADLAVSPERPRQIARRARGKLAQYRLLWECSLRDAEWAVQDAYVWLLRAQDRVDARRSARRAGTTLAALLEDQLPKLPEDPLHLV